MDEIKKIVNSFWFKAAVCGGAGTILLLYGHVLWAGFAFGWGVNEFMEYFKPSK